MEWGEGSRQWGDKLEREGDEREGRQPGVGDEGAGDPVELGVVGRGDGRSAQLRPPDADRLLEEPHRPVPLHRDDPGLGEGRRVVVVGAESAPLVPLPPAALVLFNSELKFTPSLAHIYFVAVTRDGVDALACFLFWGGWFNFREKLTAQATT